MYWNGFIPKTTLSDTEDDSDTQDDSDSQHKLDLTIMDDSLLARESVMFMHYVLCSGIKYLLANEFLRFDPGSIVTDMVILLTHVETRITHSMQDYKKINPRLIEYKNVSDVPKCIRNIAKSLFGFMIKNLYGICVFESDFEVEIRNEFS